VGFCLLCRWVLRCWCRGVMSVGLFDLVVRCPFCGVTNDTHGNVGPDSFRPRAGSLSLCHGCKKISVFKDVCAGRLALRKPSKRQQAEIDGDPQVRALRRQALAMTPQSLGLERYEFG